MALKDWMEAIMFLCRLSGSTMHRDTAKSRNTRKVLVTCKGTSRVLVLPALSLLVAETHLTSVARAEATTGWGAH